MKVQTVWRPGTDLMDIYITQDGFSGRRSMLMRMKERDLWEWKDLDEGELVDPSFTLPGDVFKALVAAGAGIPMPEAALANHLADAIKVRDRLLDKVVPVK